MRPAHAGCRRKEALFRRGRSRQLIAGGRRKRFPILDADLPEVGFDAGEPGLRRVPSDERRSAGGQGNRCLGEWALDGDARGLRSGDQPVRLRPKTSTCCCCSSRRIPKRSRNPSSSTACGPEPTCRKPTCRTPSASCGRRSMIAARRSDSSGPSIHSGMRLSPSSRTKPRTAPRPRPTRSRRRRAWCGADCRPARARRADLLAVTTARISRSLKGPSLGATPASA